MSERAPIHPDANLGPEPKSSRAPDGKLRSVPLSAVEELLTRTVDTNRRILLVDDNPAIHEDYRKILTAPDPGITTVLAELESDLFGHRPGWSRSEHFNVESALGGAEAALLVQQAADRDQPYAMAFVDVRMPPGYDGLEAAARMWQIDPDIQMVICTAYSDCTWSDMVERLGRAEQWVVLKKPFDAIEVRQLALAFTRKWQSLRENRDHAAALEDQIRQRTAALEAANRSLFDEMKRAREAERRVSHLANHDSLTGLPNRRFVETHLRYQLEQSRRRGRQVAIISVDLDRFKWVNDTLGHAAGDLVLKTVSERLAAVLRRGDCVARKEPPALDTDEIPSIDDGHTVARIGGDEFIVVLSEVGGEDDAALVAARIIETLSKPVTIEGSEVALGASLGVALQSADHVDADDLLRKADLAMREAKDSGRNTFRFYAPGHERAGPDLLWLRSGLHRALERGELQLHYQPEINVSEGGAVFGVEALLRWTDPQRGSIAPADFIPVAEETGLIIELGEYVLREACRQAAAWRAEGLVFGRVAVNVSTRQIHSTAFVDTVARQLSLAGLPASSLALEITESALATDRSDSSRVLSQLRQLGAHIALDDFGTGYSSLARLEGWPIDVIKIDRSFVARLPGDQRSAGIVKAILGLAMSLDLRVVAEGVETAAQRDALLSEGCHVMQGYFYARPMPASALAPWISNRTAIRRNA